MSGNSRGDLARSETAAVRSILVATDFSSAADLAVQRAFDLARFHGAQVTLVHAAPLGASDAVLSEAEHRLRDMTRGTRVPAVPLLATGEPSAAISQAAEELDADLVVTGARGTHWLRKLFLGSTAKALLAAISVPVLLAKREETSEYSTAVLAVDATRRSFQAVGRGIALVPDARHVLVHGVTVLGENMLRLGGADDEAVGELRDGQLATARPEIERLAGELLPPPDEVVVEATQAQALISTLSALQDADLLVVGAERRSNLRHAFMGSVSEQAMQKAPCDVLVVPLEPERP